MSLFRLALQAFLCGLLKNVPTFSKETTGHYHKLQSIMSGCLIRILSQATNVISTSTLHFVEKLTVSRILQRLASVVISCHEDLSLVNELNIITSS